MNMAGAEQRLQEAPLADLAAAAAALPPSGSSSGVGSP
jgi:hypothetical protein